LKTGRCIQPGRNTKIEKYWNKILRTISVLFLHGFYTTCYGEKYYSKTVHLENCKKKNPIQSFLQSLMDDFFHKCFVFSVPAVNFRF
jgi:hypothetical protein